MLGVLATTKLIATAAIALAAGHSGTPLAGSHPDQMTQVVISTQLGSTAYCLDSNGQGAAYADPCNGGNYQIWNQANVTPDDIEFTNYETSRCLDSGNSGGVYTLTCNGGPYQDWSLSVAGAPGRYLIMDDQTRRWLQVDAHGDLSTTDTSQDASVWTLTSNPLP